MHSAHATPMQCNAHATLQQNQFKSCHWPIENMLHYTKRLVAAQMYVNEEDLHLFPCSSEINWHVCLYTKRKVVILMFPVSPMYLCSHVSLNIKPLFSFSPNMNVIFQYLPKTWRALLILILFYI